ncbi:MAG: PilZ domain-containing protein [Deltaproteobacteria bacterium]|nr:PilZ domain-containing protein [Deltaproteobacteria bacterium]
MVDIDSKEQRSFVRANLSFKVKFRVITREEYETIKEAGDQIQSPDEKGLIFDSTDTDSRLNGIAANQCFVDFLFHIDEKLDRILAVLAKDEPDIAHFSHGAGVNIGGSGMKMVVDIPVEPGQIIHTNLVLSKFPPIFMDVFGEVIRAEPLNEDGKTVYQLGIKFLDLDINDREKIIACVFQRQRKAIRRGNREE